MDKEKQTPALRFRGFDGPWEKKKLGELSSLITKGTTPLNKSGKGEVNFIKIENINEESGTLSGLSKVSMTEHNGYLKRSRLKANDILFSIAGTLGRVCIVPKNILPANTNQALAIVRLKSDNLQFIKICLQGKAIKNFLEKNPTVGAQPNLSLEQVSNLEFMEPPTLLEQTKIGELGKQFNDVIFNCEQKIKKAEQFRRAMLSKLFPAEGASEPALRFRGFSGAWKKCKLASFGKATGGVSLEAEFIENGTYKVINIGSYSGESKYIDQGLRTNKTKRTAARILNKNDLVMILNDKTSEGNIIGRVLLIDADDTYVYNQRNERIEVNQSQFVPQFLYELLNADVVRNKIIRAAQGATQIYVNWSVISQLTYMIPPSINEQKQIGDFFYQLDSYISLQREKREKLRRLKAALLEKLFV